MLSLGLASDFLLLSAIDAAARLPLEIAGRRKRNSNLVRLLVANIQSPGNAGVAKTIRFTRGYKIVDAMG